MAPDDDDYERGPGRRTRGPLIESYVEVDADKRPCPPKSAGGCGVAVDEWCRHPGGWDRKIPCVARVKPPKPRGVAAAVDARLVADAVGRARGVRVEDKER